MTKGKVRAGDNEALNALLAAYAAGTLSAPLHVLIGSHLELCPRNREFVVALEAMVGRHVSEIEPIPVPNRNERLKAIFSGSRACAMKLAGPCAILPPLLRSYIASDLSSISWRSTLPGVKEHPVRCGDSEAASLTWIRAGRKLPSHSHQGSEVILVLKGGFSDVTGHYLRGDVQIADPDLNRYPIADREDDCICFSVREAPLRLSGPIGRWLDRICGKGR